MTYVITSPCVATCDTACVDVCPVDAIAGPIDVAALRAVPVEERARRLPGARMFIDPDACICCGACAPVCPVSAIVSDSDLPPAEEASLAAAVTFFEGRRRA